MELQVSDVAVARGGVAVLEGAEFTAAAGEVLILRGPNGIGKTTLLRALAGLQPLLAGRVSAPPEAITFAGHADGLKSTLTTAENLRFWAKIHGHDEIGPALAAMNLEKLVDRPAQNLSAGQKRRLGLARLAVTKRPIWLLDEPTVSLDAASVALFAALVRGHLETGGIAVIATHIDLGLSEARRLDLSEWRARAPDQGGFAGAFDEAFL